MRNINNQLIALVCRMLIQQKSLKSNFKERTKHDS